VEIRVGPSEIRSTPLTFNTSDTGSSQSTRTVDISGDNAAITSGKTSMTSSTSSEEDEGACGRVFVVVSESFGGGLPMNEGGVETTGRATVSQTNEMIAHSLVFPIVGVGHMSFSPGDGLSAGSGVLETSRAVTTRRSRSGGRVTTAGTSRLTIIGNESTADVSSLGRNVIPDVGSARETSDSVTVDLAVDFELRVGADHSNNVGVSVGGTSDVNGFRSSMDSSGETQDGAHAERGS
jgi:hypothetical protein